MYFSDALALLCAIVIFLFGMELLCTGLEELSQGYTQTLLSRAGDSMWRAVLFGTVVTALVQSSSAVTSVIVGLAACGMLSPRQSAGLIAGANLGTCSTAFFVHFGLRTVQPDFLHGILPLLVLSALLPLLLRRRCPAVLAAGAGLLALLTGMVRMQDALAQLSGSPLLIELLSACHTPLTGFFAGIVATAVLQSSSACIAILQASAASGVLSIGSVVPIILGQNIGTCSTALLASVRAGHTARRTALLHLQFNLLGAAAVFPVLLVLPAVCPQLLAQPADSGAIAWVHLLCNLAAALVFLPLAAHQEAQAHRTA
ncbi:MAG: Na/Pi symporter [Eubacteriales bacterium]|nr:Na/Pi symporter [Eubacteriales bacterium]